MASYSFEEQLARNPGPPRIKQHHFIDCHHRRCVALLEEIDGKARLVMGQHICVMIDHGPELGAIIHYVGKYQDFTEPFGVMAAGVKANSIPKDFDPVRAAAFMFSWKDGTNVKRRR